jgi:hypothetical protein
VLEIGSGCDSGPGPLMLMNIAADDPEAPVRVGAFAQGLQELGWTIGRNLRIE